MITAHFASDAANGLVQLCRREGLLPEPPSGHMRTNAIRVIRSFQPSAVIRSRADAIFAAATNLPSDLPAGFDPKRMGVALALLNDPRAIDLLLLSPTEYSGHLVGAALHVMASFGTTLPGRAIAAALEPSFAAGEAIPNNSGYDPWHGIVKGFAVLLASDTPSVAVERMRRVPAARFARHHGRELFAVLAACRKPEAGEYLVELSRTLPADADNYPDLIDALGASEYPACRTRLLEMGAQSGSQPTREALRREFVRAAEEDPSFASALRGLLQTASEQARGIFVASLADIESEAAMVALLSLSDLKPIAGILRQMVRGVTQSAIPAENSGGHYLVPRAANDVRQKLAAMLLSDSPDQRSLGAGLSEGHFSPIAALRI